MEKYEFKFKTLDQLKEYVEKEEIHIPLSENTEVLLQKAVYGGKEIANRIVTHPMEGCDGNPDGSPGELTIRRYDRFSKGGSGLIWFEAVAIEVEGKANPRQLMITEENKDSFKKLCSDIKENCYKEFGFTPVVIMQITHSGRFSRPYGKPAPIVACSNLYLDEVVGINSDYKAITDDELEGLQEKYVKTALLAKYAGFDGVDIKSCHRYLISELYSAFTREGKYGGDYEGRTRFILELVEKIKNVVPKDFLVTTRMNIYDGIPYPYGFGMKKDESLEADLSDPIRLAREFDRNGAGVINISMGTPYYNPYVSRPFDKGNSLQPENPLYGVERMIWGATKIQDELKETGIVATGFSYLRHLAPYVAAGAIENGLFPLIGLGRMAFACPDFAKYIMQEGKIPENKACIACSKCSDIMKVGGTPGCVIRDSSTYSSIYQKYCGK